MTKAIKTDIAEPATEPVEIDVVVNDLSLTLQPSLYNALVQTVMEEVLRDAAAWIEWNLDEPDPLVQVSFAGLEAAFFPLRDMLANERELASSVTARDGLVAMFEDAARRLRAIDDDFYGQFYSRESGRCGTDR